MVVVVGSSMVDSHTSPCLCLDAVPTTNISLKNSGDLVLPRNSMKKKQYGILRSSFVDSWQDCRLSSRPISDTISKCWRKQRKDRRLVVVNEVAGQYEDNFEDVKTQMLNYFTYKAVRTVLNQLYEMNPTKYRWFYDFVASNKPGDGKRFLRILVKEKQDLGERVMITRLHLYGKWVKKCNHAEIYNEISNENLELMRERLMETVIWPSDDTNTEKIG
ncbi:hypothetical protein K2173_022076 [Erythroxylum novogranatense]|uniref:Chaperonin-like RbcX protein n=1 Tax=Erythroxylum novogranatense TaxID=1862640 RepID=A0AAV8TXZ6_9ROSI|nr:hypothetical protein K2173_022076 [Erythroxylum novogranatense]